MNLEQHARRDLLARVARATVTEVQVVGMRKLVGIRLVIETRTFPRLVCLGPVYITRPFSERCYKANLGPRVCVGYLPGVGLDQFL
jgi:hypothetical protein